MLARRSTTRATGGKRCNENVNEMQRRGGGGQTKRPSGTKDVNVFGFPSRTPLPTLGNPDASRGQGPRRKEPSTTALCTLLHQHCAFSPGPHQRPEPGKTEMRRVDGYYWGAAAAMTLLSGEKGSCYSLPCRLFWYPIAGLSCEADPGSRKPRWTPPGPVNLFPCLPTPQRDALKQYANRQWPSMQCAWLTLWPLVFNVLGRHRPVISSSVGERSSQIMQACQRCSRRERCRYKYKTVGKVPPLKDLRTVDLYLSSWVPLDTLEICKTGTRGHRRGMPPGNLDSFPLSLHPCSPPLFQKNMQAVSCLEKKRNQHAVLAWEWGTGSSNTNLGVCLS